MRLPWTTATVLISVIVSVTVVYVFVPDHRAEIILGVGVAGSAVLAYMRGKQ